MNSALHLRCGVDCNRYCQQHIHHAVEGDVVSVTAKASRSNLSLIANIVKPESASHRVLYSLELASPATISERLIERHYGTVVEKLLLNLCYNLRALIIINGGTRPIDKCQVAFAIKVCTFGGDLAAVTEIVNEQHRFRPTKAKERYVEIAIADILIDIRPILRCYIQLNTYGL